MLKFHQREQIALAAGKVTRNQIESEVLRLTAKHWKEAADLHASRPDYRDTFYHASSLSKCITEYFWDLVISDAEKDGKPIFKSDTDTAADYFKMQRIFGTGTAFHMRMQVLFERMGILVAKEVPLKSTKLLLLSSADAVVKLNGKPVLIELKSIGPSGFGGSLPKPEHVDQALLYMGLLRRLRETKPELCVEKGIILYEEKGRHDLKECSVDLDKKRIAELFKRTDTLETSRKTLKPPPRPYHEATEYPCKGCAFWDPCWRPKTSEAILTEIKRRRENRQRSAEAVAEAPRQA